MFVILLLLLVLLLLLLLFKAFNLLFQLLDKLFDTRYVLAGACKTGLQLECIVIRLHILLQRVHYLLQGFRGHLLRGRCALINRFCGAFSIQRAQLIEGGGGINLPQLVKGGCLQRGVFIEQGCGECFLGFLLFPASHVFQAKLKGCGGFLCRCRLNARRHATEKEKKDKVLILFPFGAAECGKNQQ